MGEMPLSVACAAIEKYKEGLKEVIPSTMGEPLLYSKFSELLEYCAGKGFRVNLTTNGTFPGTWGSDGGMNQLLRSCCDVKISALAFENNGPFAIDAWKRNVERLLDCRRMLESLGERELSSVSLQVTLHRKNVDRAEELLRWAESVGVHRVKWNPIVFLSTADRQLVAEYGLESFDLEELRGRLTSTKVKCGGSLFFGNKPGDGSPSIRESASDGTSANQRPSGCSFLDERWILPDGSEQNCPNPERRFGNPDSPAAQCVHCPMK